VRLRTRTGRSGRFPFHDRSTTDPLRIGNLSPGIRCVPVEIVTVGDESQLRLRPPAGSSAGCPRAVAMSIRSHALDVAGRRGPRRDKVAAAGRRPSAAVVCPEPVFDGRVGNRRPLDREESSPESAGKGGNQHADALSASNRWSGCLDGRTRHSAWPVPRMGAHVRSHCSQKLAAETRNQPFDLRRDGRI
jgi:hypothetical protein